MSAALRRQLPTHFCSITGASPQTAVHCLDAAGWQLEAAIDMYYSEAQYESVASAGPTSDRGAIEAMFQQYKDGSQGIMLAEGVASFCEDLQVDPADPVMLVISFYFRAATMCEFSRDEFVDGMMGLSCDSLAKLRQKLPELRLQLRDEGKFKDIYEFAYGFSCEKGQKCLQLDTAVAMWQLLFAKHPWVLLDAWIEFLQTHHKRAISKDTWVQLLDFSKAIKPDLSNFEESESAWPYLFDEFVETLREERKKQDESIMVIDDG